MATITKPIALDESFHTTGQNPRNIADVLAEGLSHITGRTASEVEYDNTESELTADNVQDAIDEVNGKIPTLPTTDIQTAVDEFSTYNGGLLSECIIELVPVQSGSGDPSPDNVRPISGHTQVEVGDDGKNRFNPNSYESFDITGGGAIRYGHEFDSGDYTLINNGTGSSGYFYRIVAKDYSSYGSSVQIANNTSVNVDVDDAHFLRVFTASWDATADNIAVIEGTDETFVPYNGYQVTVNLGGTYYSGVLDIVTGVFVVTQKKIIFNGTEYWDKSGVTFMSRFILRAIDSLYGVNNTSAICDTFKPIDYDTETAIRDTEIGVLSYSSGRFDQIAINYSLDPSITTETFKTFLSNNNVEVVLPLTTPQTIQLTPQQVKALVGKNHLSAPLDGQEITEVKYKKMFTFDDVIAYIQSLS